MKTYQKLGSVIALVLGCAGAANSSTTIPLYDNLGDGTIDAGVNFFTSAGGSIANKFSTLTLCPSGCTLGNITLNLTDITGGTSTSGYQLQVFADTGGSPGGSPLISFNNPQEGFTSSAASNLFTPIGTLNLGSNTNYWVKLSGTNPADSITWGINSSAIQTVLGQPNQGLWSMVDSVSGSATNLLMRVEATPNAVPVPGAVWMMGSALIGVVSSWRRKVL